MPDPQQYTDAQLSDGRTLRFLGQLAPDEVKQKVHAFRTKEGSQQISSAPPGVPKPAGPAELQSGMTQTDQGPMPYSKATASGPMQPPGQAEKAMGFGVGSAEQTKDELRPVALGAATAAPILSGGMSIPAQMAIGGVSGAAQSKLEGGSNTEALTSGAIGAALPAAGPVMGKLGQSAKVIGKAAGATAEELPVVGKVIKGVKAGSKALGELKDVWGEKPVYPGAPFPEHPGTFSKVPLGPEHPGTFSKVPLGPEKPPPNVLKGIGLGRGAQSADVSQPAQALKSIASPVYPGAPLPLAPDLAPAPLGPEAPTPELAKSQGLANGGKTAPPDPAAALKGVPVRTPVAPTTPEPMPKAVASSKLELGLKQGLGAAEPNVKPGAPMYQGPARESSAVDSFKYDPSTKQMHVTAKDGITHVYGDVSQDQADAFQNNPSKGRAWQELQKSPSVKVAKISPEGIREPNRGASKLKNASPEDEGGSVIRFSPEGAPEPKIGGPSSPENDLTDQWTKARDLARKQRAGR